MELSGDASELTSGEPIGQGSSSTTVNRGRKYVAAIPRYERPGLLVFEVAGDPMDITATFRFRPAGEETGFVGEFDTRPKGFMSAMFPLLKPRIRRDPSKQVAELQDVLRVLPACHTSVASASSTS